MDSTKSITFRKSDVLIFLGLMSVATVAPLAKNQFITGTIVNCTLILTACFSGIRAALLIAIIPSTIALATGLLPAVLAPMIPFIILGNALLIIIFDYFRKINYWLGAICGAVIKFGLLAGVSSIVIGLLMNKNLATNVAYMMSWPQLVTALAGSLVAYIILFYTQQLNR